MHLPDERLVTSPAASLHIRVAHVNVRIEAPERVLVLLNETLSNVPRFGLTTSPDLTIEVISHDDVWQVRGREKGRYAHFPHTTLPQVGGAIVTRTIGEVASSCNYRTMRATVVERGGRALALIGDDWESAITLATHFHGRGWHYVGSDHALFDPETQEMHCVQKSLYVNASSISQLPVRYRHAVEASPWYVTPRGISFYAVDPSAAGMKATWTRAARLCGVVVVDGTMVDSPALEPIDGKRLQEERLAQLGIDWSTVDIADLRMGGCVETCDLLEHWFGAIAHRHA